MSPNLPIDSMDRAPSHHKPAIPRASDIAARLAAGETLATTLVLEPPCAFINANDRTHHHAKAKLTRLWREAAARAVDDGFNPVHYTRAHITIGIRFDSNRRRDVGNYYPTAKAIVDGLVDALLLPDDNDSHIVGPDMRRTRPNGTPQVTVTITPLEETS